MKKNGFTLVELLAVLIILGLLMAIAIPSALRIANSVKDKAYQTKIDLIEEAGKEYGQSNVASIQTGTGTCTFTISNNEIAGVAYKAGNKTLGTNTYMCTPKTVAELVDTGNLNWDDENYCETNANCGSVNKVVLNPKTKAIINSCTVYIYYKNKRVYAYFDKEKCVS